MVRHLVRADLGLVDDRKSEPGGRLEVDRVEADPGIDEESAALEARELVRAPVIADDGNDGVGGGQRPVGAGLREAGQERVAIAARGEGIAGPRDHLLDAVRVDAGLDDVQVFGHRVSPACASGRA